MKAGKKDSKRWMILPLALSTVSVVWVVLCVLNVVGAPLTVHHLYHKLVIPILRLLLYLSLGLLIGLTLEGLGFSAKLGRLAGPLTRWGHLKHESGSAVVTSFVSNILANTLFMSLYTAGKISRKELVLGYLVNSGVPTFVVHLPTTFFVVVSLAREAGLAYLGWGGPLCQDKK